jgi:hypothetical protein
LWVVKNLLTFAVDWDLCEAEEVEVERKPLDLSVPLSEHLAEIQPENLKIQAF